MSQNLIEKALRELKTLLINEVKYEKEFQIFFERNPIVFKLMGFTEIHSQLKLHSNNGDNYFPDFILKNGNGLCEVCDIKLPNEKIIKKKKRRDDFYSKIGSEYAGQLRNYAKYFSDKENRDNFENIYKFKVNANPIKLLIVGRSSTDSRSEIHEILDARSHEFNLVTYDDILDNLRHSLKINFRSEGQFFGTSFLIILKLKEVVKNSEQYIVDFGDNNSKSRFSIYLDNFNNLCFRIIDSLGNAIVMKAYKSRKQFFFNEYFYVYCSTGCSDNYSVMDFRINGERIEKREFEFNFFDKRGLNYDSRIFAANMFKKEGATLYFELIKGFNYNLNFYDLIKEDSEFLRRLSWARSQDNLISAFFDYHALVELKYHDGQKSPLDKSSVLNLDVENIDMEGAFIKEHRARNNQAYN